MGQQHLFDLGRKPAWRMFLTILAAVSLTGCGTALFGGGNDKTQTDIWKHRDQFVRIEAQDRTAGTVPPNEHPARIDAAELRTMLGSIEVRFQPKGRSILGNLADRIQGDEKPAPMFTNQELEILGDAISAGLAQAGPRQDVTFAIVGVHRGLIGFSHDRAFITGRVFVQGGKLNLIIGSLHEGYEENLDRRMFPFEVGSRQYKAPSSREKAPRAWQPVPVAGLQTPTVDGRVRHDWLILDLNPETWKAAIAVRKEAGEAAKAAFQEASQVREESAQLSAEQERLRSELEAVKQDLERMRQTPAAAPVVAPAPAPTAPRAPAVVPGAEDLEVRLRRLQYLRDRNLLTEEEFRAKRKEILEAL